MKHVLVLVVVLGITAVPMVSAQEKAKAPAAKEQSAPAPQYKNVKPEEFDKLRKADSRETVVLDVRTKEENSRGRIPGSILIDFTSENFDQEIAKLDKNKTYLVHCASGGRSARACKKMDSLGFKKLYNLEGGMTAWEKVGKPVETK